MKKENSLALFFFIFFGLKEEGLFSLSSFALKKKKCSSFSLSRGAHKERSRKKKTVCSPFLRFLRAYKNRP